MFQGTRIPATSFPAASPGRAVYTEGMDERFDVLETKVAYHDKELSELNSVVYQQQLVIDRLNSQLERVSAQLKLLGIEGNGEKYEKPPHY